jgi:CO/xanthine dehydrogenase Mo-binding subunit
MALRLHDLLRRDRQVADPNPNGVIDRIGNGCGYARCSELACAQIAEASLNRQTGEIPVHNVWCAVDAGVAIQPLNVETQMISAITHGASHALFEQITFVNGEVQESNFDTYRVMRMSEAPDIALTVIQTPENPPAGVGEAGLPPTGPASPMQWRGSPAGCGCGTSVPAGAGEGGAQRLITG